MLLLTQSCYVVEALQFGANMREGASSKHKCSKGCTKCAYTTCLSWHMVTLPVLLLYVSRPRTTKQAAKCGTGSCNCTHTHANTCISAAVCMHYASHAYLARSQAAVACNLLLAWMVHHSYVCAAATRGTPEAAAPYTLFPLLIRSLFVKGLVRVCNLGYFCNPRECTVHCHMRMHRV